MIAIVGMACVYPDAGDPRALWENVLARRRAFRRMPPERLNLRDYFSTDPNAADAIYASEAALIEAYEFDRVRFRVAGATYRSADLTHWLALDVADRALTDAGLAGGEGLPRDSTGVLIGNTLTGEFSRAALMRLRWPYVRRMLDKRLAEAGFDDGRRRAFLTDLEARYKAPFEPIGEESLAGGLSNTIAGRICNTFNLRGGGYTIDGACSSSLLAVAQACSALEAGDLDAAIVGGVDLSLDPFELIGFAKTGALAHGEMRVYDRRSDGFLPGEGCGMLVLMRQNDALARGLRIYATVRGWGIASDGSGGITRPEVEGQQLALQRAYRRAGFAIDSVALFEGHGTGTAVGDEVELRALTGLLPTVPEPPAIGSIKANIGHTKAAAGVAGMIKAVTALYRQVLPPATGVGSPHPQLATGKLQVLSEGRVWPAERPLRAGVSSFGFGGINVHIALEAAVSTRRQALTEPERELLQSAQDCELFVFDADDEPALDRQIAAMIEPAAGLSRAELTDLAAQLARNLQRRSARAAIVAALPRELVEGLQTIRRWLSEGVKRRLAPEAGLFLGIGCEPPRIGLLFPGQAAPVRFTGGALARRCIEVRELYQQADLQHGDPNDTAIAQPAIVIAELAGLSFLSMLGITAERAIGHSLGELTALHWAGAMERDALLRTVRFRAEQMAAVGSGGMLSVQCAAAVVTDWIAGEPWVVLAGLNSPKQTILAGDPSALDRIAGRARQLGIAATRLPVSGAFHSPLMQAAAASLRRHLDTEAFAPLQRSVWSTITGGELSPDADLRALLEQQLTTPVRFETLIRTGSSPIDLWLEVGPGRILAGLVDDAEVRTGPVISLDCSSESIRGLLLAAGATHTLGAGPAVAKLFAERLTRPFDLHSPPRFFVNPCERAPVTESSEPAVPSVPVSVEATLLGPPTESHDVPTDALSLLRSLVAEKAELPLASVADDHHLLRDLHLNSISVGQLLSEAARRLNRPPPLAPTAFADATLSEAAAVLDTLEGTAAFDASDRVPAGIGSWVRAFAVERFESSAPARDRSHRDDGQWELLAPDDHPVGDAILAALRRWGRRGVLVCLSDPFGDEDAERLLNGAQRARHLDGTDRYFVVVQQHGFAFAFARTAQMEEPGLHACVVDLPFDHDCAQKVVDEVSATAGYREAIYQSDGRRFSQGLRLLSLPSPAAACEDASIVLLVTGGGKGIAAECALALGRERGWRLALVGRANPQDDPELAENLKRFQAAGLRFGYYIADVTEPHAIQTAVTRIEQTLGPVNALLHGAGLNQPTPLSRLTWDAMSATLNPKIAGLRNLLAAVDQDRLRYLIGFASVIGRIGLPGEADYALANAWMTRLTDDFAKSHPRCRCLSLEWSVWAGVGMGERLGRLESLLREGIEPVSIDLGTAQLLALLDGEPRATTVVVSGRLGAKPPLPLLPAADLPFLRFLETPRLHYPGIELIVDAVLSQPTDPYLRDHTFNGECLLPAVIGMEAMAQCAQAVLGCDELLSFEHIEFLQPIIIGEGDVVLRTVALVAGADEVRIALRCSLTGFLTDHVRATCRRDRQRGSNPPRQQADAGSTLTASDALYGSILFQRGRFRRLQGYTALTAYRGWAEVLAEPVSGWFSRYLPQTLVLGDAGSRDASIHLIQACIPHRIVLPIGVQRFTPGRVEVAGTLTVIAQERWHEGDIHCWDVDVLTADGDYRERWEGLRLREVEPAAVVEWPPLLVGPYLERVLADWMPSRRSGIVCALRSSENRRLDSDRMMQRAAGSHDAILHRPDGKPEINGKHSVSAAHAEPLVLAVAGDPPLACDLEWIVARDRPTWRGLLSPAHDELAMHTAESLNEAYDTAATRVWTVLECLTKAGLPIDAPLILENPRSPGWVLYRSADLVIASWVARLTIQPGHIAAAILGQASCTPTPTIASQCALTSTAT